MTEPSDPVAAILDGLARLGNEYQSSFAAAADELALREAHAKILGKKGSLTRALALMRHVPKADRPRVGVEVNGFKQGVEQAFASRLEQLATIERQRDLDAPPFDLSLPGRPSLPGRGHLHPVMQTRDDLLEIFRDLGFEVVAGPEVELEENNFTKLAFPPDHPATDMQDTFWVDVLGADQACKPGAVLLRTHTSNTQIRVMSQRQPPMAVVSAGAVYRRDDDLTHSPMFHQIEGFLVDEQVSMADLRGVLTAFVKQLYGQTRVRLRPSYFPFVEPGAELDIGCVFCDDETRSSCRVCKQSGWVEVLGCGMIHPEVLTHCGIDSERYTGYAFGFGVERIAMLRYGIPSIKLLFDNDPRFLQQF